MKPVPCKICGSKNLHFVHYKYETTDEELYLLAKRVECKDCRASTPVSSINCDDAIDTWNNYCQLAFHSTEDLEVEESPNDK